MDSSRLGRRGEEEAARFLEARGWAILDRNVRWGRKEVDIIASKSGVLAFVEVKSRSNGNYGHPLDAITPAKRREIAGVARDWLRGRALSPGTLIRFDAVSVFWRAGRRPEVSHLPDAWRIE